MLFLPGNRNEGKKGIVPFFRPRYTKDCQTVKGTRFCMETSSHQKEMQWHTEAEPDFLLVKNVHENLQIRGKQTKMSHFKDIATLCRIKAPHHVKSSDRDVVRS